MSGIYAELLRSWCEALLKLQVKEMDVEGIHGGIMCPACSRIHGRCLDAIYPFMYMADTYQDDRYLQAAMDLFQWSDHVTRPDGSWINDTNSEWKGITVFGAIQLGEAIRHHGRILDRPVYENWKTRLRAAAEYLYHNINMSTGNINYPISCSAAMAIAGLVLDDPSYLERGRELAHDALDYFTENKLIFGEGHPQTGVTSRGCRAVDLGYNVEESLPNLVLYGILAEDGEVLEVITMALKKHLEFMLPDGGWDNSWGTRNYKWTYWGSRTSDGCQAAYALLGDRDPLFVEAALRNTRLLQECTHDGMLYGGPHYYTRGELPCIHHTFCHAKALASVLDHGVQVTVNHDHILLPREEEYGIREFPEISTWLVSKGQWRGTVTAYDWEYIKGGHTSGGAISMLWHEKAGPVLAASLTEYQMNEPNNMQIPKGSSHMCLTPRLEYEENGVLYRSIHDFEAAVSYTQANGSIQFEIDGRLVDLDRRDPDSGSIRYTMLYTFTNDEIVMDIQLQPPLEKGTVIYHVPVISESQEKAVVSSSHSMIIQKHHCQVVIHADQPMDESPASENSRIFNLVPGFEAIPLAVRLPNGHMRLVIKVIPLSE
ncbi:MAG: hypothetical protein ACOX6S_04960 [Clostridia bacterium]